MASIKDLIEGVLGNMSGKRALIGDDVLYKCVKPGQVPVRLPDGSTDLRMSPTFKEGSKGLVLMGSFGRTIALFDPADAAPGFEDIGGLKQFAPDPNAVNLWKKLRPEKVDVVPVFYEVSNWNLTDMQGVPYKAVPGETPADEQKEPDFSEAHEGEEKDSEDS